MISVVINNLAKVGFSSDCAKNSCMVWMSWNEKDLGAPGVHTLG